MDDPADRVLPPGGGPGGAGSPPEPALPGDRSGDPVLAGSAAPPRPEPPSPAGDRRLLARLRVDAGLCASCAHLLLLASARSVFVRCGLAATDPAFPRYPALPVLACSGYRRAEPAAGREPGAPAGSGPARGSDEAAGAGEMEGSDEVEG
jgi:hypothetical protein